MSTCFSSVSISTMNGVGGASVLAPTEFPRFDFFTTVLTPGSWVPCHIGTYYCPLKSIEMSGT